MPYLACRVSARPRTAGPAATAATAVTGFARTAARARTAASSCSSPGRPSSCRVAAPVPRSSGTTARAASPSRCPLGVPHGKSGTRSRRQRAAPPGYSRRRRAGGRFWFGAHAGGAAAVVRQGRQVGRRDVLRLARSQERDGVACMGWPSATLSAEARSARSPGRSCQRDGARREPDCCHGGSGHDGGANDRPGGGGALRCGTGSPGEGLGRLCDGVPGADAGRHGSDWPEW
jgi:hypothetical protein